MEAEMIKIPKKIESRISQQVKKYQDILTDYSYVLPLLVI